MNPNTPWAKAPWVRKLWSFRSHFCFWESSARLRPLGGRLIALLLYAFVLGRFTVWFCVVGLVAPRPKGSISVKDVGWFMGSAHSAGKLCGNGNACLHLLGWTLAEELLTMLLKEWSGKKDLRLAIQLPKRGKSFKAQLSWHYSGLVLSYDGRIVTPTQNKCERGRLTLENFYASIWFNVSMPIILYMFF